jgi:hypothetical protein
MVKDILGSGIAELEVNSASLQDFVQYLSPRRYSERL